MSKQQEIEQLERELAVLNDHQDELRSEVDELVGKRDKLNVRFRNLRAETSKLRDVRDEANIEVKELKLKRTGMKAKRQEKIEELKALAGKVGDLTKRKPTKAHVVLQKEFENIEWKIQTTSLDLQEEKQLVDQVRQTEAQLNIYKGLQHLKDKIFEVQTELKALAVEGKLCHEKLTNIAQRSQETHLKMLVMIEESKKTREKADSLHQMVMQTREKLKTVRDETVRILTQIAQLRGEVREQETKQKKLDEDSMRERLEKEARQKLKRGAKLTWEEFQLLGEKGMEEPE